MAETVPCRSCGMPVAPDAPVCPHCGASYPGRAAPPVMAAPPAATHVVHAGPTPVVLTGLHIPFGNLVLLIIKVMLAAIPAYLLVLALFLLVSSLIHGFYGGFR